MGKKEKIPPRARLPYVLFLEHYTNKCFVYKAKMKANGAGVLWGSLKDDQKGEIMVHIPTRQFFALHNLYLANLELWDHMNLREYFEVPTWGPNYMKSYQALNTITTNYASVVIGFQCKRRELQARAA